MEIAKMKRSTLRKIIFKTGVSIASLAFSASAASQNLKEIKINPVYSYFFDYDSINVSLFDGNKDGKVDKIEYLCWLPQGEKIEGQSLDKDYNGAFESGKYKWFDEKGFLESVGNFSLDFLSRAIRGYSAGGYRIYKR